MTNNTELLESIYKNAELGRDILRKMIKHSDDGSMREAMAEQFARYHEILSEADSLLEKKDAPSIPCGKAARTPVFASLGINLRIDKTSSHMAEMLVLGNTMGLIDTIRDVREYGDASEEAKSLAQKLIEAQEASIAEMRVFL